MLITIYNFYKNFTQVGTIISLVNTTEDKFFRIWFNNKDREEYFETIRLNLGDSVKVNSDKYKIYDIINRVANNSIKKYIFKNKKAVLFIFNLNNDEKYSEYSIKSRFSACLISNKFHLKEYFTQMIIKPKVNNYKYDDK